MKKYLRYGLDAAILAKYMKEEKQVEVKSLKELAELVKKFGIVEAIQDHSEKADIQAELKVSDEETISVIILYPESDEPTFIIKDDKYEAAKNWVVYNTINALDKI